MISHAEEVLKKYPHSFPVLNLCGIGYACLGRFEEATTAFKRALTIEPHYLDAQINLAKALKSLQRYEEAIEVYTNVVKNKPECAEGHYNLGVTFYDLKRFEQAIGSFIKTIEIKADHAEAYNNLGAALSGLKRFDEAITVYKKAINFRSEYAEAYNNLANTLCETRRFLDAIIFYQKALQIKPNDPTVHNNLGNVLKNLNRYEEAITAYKKAFQLRPNYAEVQNNLGNAYSEIKLLKEAIDAYGKTLQINKDHTEAKARRIHLLSQISDWQSLSNISTQEIAALGTSGEACPPFSLLSFEDSPERHLIRSKYNAKQKYHQKELAPLKRPSVKPSTLRIGYFSADFHNHATMYLMARLFEVHDKKRFSVFAYSYGPDKKDEMRQRLIKAVDVFKDVRHMSDKDIAELARNNGIDIAVDLKGYTQDTRFGIFACRAAPIQITYLGYPGTTGAPYIDYLIADRTVIPQGYEKYYSEKIIYLPHSYQVNDNQREISNQKFTRAEVGLPEEAFVFCCFNNSYKITPVEFDIWMRLLGKVENSVLWLLKDNPWSEINLKKQAEKKGIDPKRLLFAERMQNAEHLARQRLADLFLDTFNVNAHTTASDALWAGLPVVTKVGEGFAARVGASLLVAVGLPELITRTQEEYEAKSLELAEKPEKLNRIKKKLEENRLQMPLFDTQLTTKHLELAYEQSYMRWFENKEQVPIEIS